MKRTTEPNACKIYLQQSVLEAARERMVWIFDTFQTVSVSVSGGKDSSVLFDLAYREAEKRGRELHVFFLDQEAEYASSIEIVDDMMRRPLSVPHWYQVPCLMTNATSYEEDMLKAWEPGAQWMRPKVDIAITEPLPVDRFYRIMEYVDASWGANACSLVGLRSEESLNRFGAVTRNPAIDGINWSSKGKTPDMPVKLYPLYDWTFEDVWTYIGTEGIRYNRVYDWMHVKGRRLTEMRVSNLIHEKSYKSLADLQEFEPDTYDRLVARLKGVSTAARYAREQTVFSVKKRPANFDTWKAYRDFLLDTFTGDKRQAFTDRFDGQLENERVYRQQVKQLLINDWENNVPVVQQQPKENPLKKWMEIL